MFKRFFLILSMLFSSFFSFSVFAGDYLDQALGDENTTAQEHQIITTDVTDKKVETWVQKTAKLMLKLAVMIGVTIFLYGGIRFFLSMGDDGKAKKTRDTLIVSALGLVIAFGAWAILELFMSVAKTVQEAGT